MQRDLVNGVPVFWAAGPAPLTAGLVFGVGRRDESFLRGGITHLVEHLAMGVLGRTTLDCNATVDLTTTQFTVSGEPVRVAEFLHRICQALSELPLDRLTVEADVLRTEGGGVATPAVGALLAERYGACGFGLAGFGEPAMLSLTAEDVQAWAGTYFVRGSAALWLSGPPPEGLSLPLVDAEAPVRAPQPVRPLTTPALVEHPVDGAVGLGAEVTRRLGLGAMTRILRDRVEDDLRHRRGLSYSVTTELLVVDRTRRFVALTADSRDGKEAVVARALWQGVTRLAQSGATEQELAHDREGLVEYLSDGRSQVDEVQSAAEAFVIGVEHRTVEELRCETSELEAEQVRLAAQAVLDGPLLGVPFGTELRLAALTPVPSSSGDVLQGRSFRRRRIGSDAPRGAHLIVGDDGATIVLSDDERRAVRYADVVALLQLGPAEWSLVGVDGTSLPLAPGDWRNGERALDVVRAAVPASLQACADSTAPDGRRVLLVHAPPAVAFEALWPSKQDARVAQTSAWTLVAREEPEEQAYANAAGISSAVGRRGAVLLLEQAHDELRLVLFHRGKERDRHWWTGEQHDPAVLASVLDEDPEQIAGLLAHDGSPVEVLAALEQVLGVPEQTGQLLAGADPGSVVGLTQERARGVRESIAAAARGEYDPPDSPKLSHRLSRWERERPPGYRLANAGAAAAQAAIAFVAATRADGDWTSWPGVLTAMFGIGAAGSLWSTRPPPG